MLILFRPRYIHMALFKLIIKRNDATRYKVTIPADKCYATGNSNIGNRIIRPEDRRPTEKLYIRNKSVLMEPKTKKSYKKLNSNSFKSAKNSNFE